MNIEAFVDTCIAHGISISMAGDNLRVTRGSDTPAELIDQIKARKQELIDWIAQRSRLADGSAMAITRADRSTRHLPLSYAQNRLWFVDRLERSWQYNISETLRLTGPFNARAMQLAVQSIVERHEVLRTTFVEIDGVPYQVVNEAVPFEPATISLADVAPRQVEAEIGRLAAEEAHRVFDLTRDVMLRVTVIAVSANEHVLLFTTHHIASDGWSMSVLVREFMAFYDAYASDRTPDVPELPLQYADYAHWQKSEFQHRHFEEALDRTLARLDGMPQLHALPLDFQRSATQAFTGDTYRHIVAPERLARLNAICRERGVTLFTLLQSAYALLIGRWSNEDEVVIGSPTAGRTHTELRPLIGFFLNNIVLRNRLSATATFLDYLAAAQEDTLAAISDQVLPFEMLVEAARPERSRAYSPMFQLVFVLQNTESAQFALEDLQIASASRHSVKFDLELSARETESGLALDWIYADTLFRRDTVVRLAESFETLLAGIAADPAANIFDLPIMPPSDLASLAQWSAGSTVAQPATTVYRLFEEQALATPDAVAVRSGATHISYRDLHAKARLLGAYLRDEGITPTCKVGICLRRSIPQVIAVLGVLAAGAAYVPLEPNHPKDMLDGLIADAGLELVLVESALLEKLPLTGIDVTLMDEALSPQWLQAYADESTDPAAAAGELMYVLYTSGSTGRPKGVMVPHEGVVNYLRHGLLHYGMAAHAGAVVSTPLCFDATVTTLFLPLISGKELVLAPEDGPGMVQELATLLFEREDSLLFKVTPAHLDLLDAHVGQAAAMAGAPHTIVVGGEQFTLASARRWKEDLLPSATFVNEYGPTETVVGCSTFTLADSRDLAGLAGRSAVAIGRPIANTTLAVLDARRTPCPIGAIGELYIGGSGVTRGYLGRADLTAERFLPLPLDHASAAHWYRSGDLVRYLPDGQLEFVGRADKQVKIRGYRIEPGEIEALLDDLEGVRKAAIVVDETAAGKRLVAFIVANTAAEAALPAQATQYLRRKLPEYMVPELIQVIADWPLTVNGKLDVKAMLAMLAAPDGELVAPQGATEHRLWQVWRDLLGHDAISAQHNFFDVGGHSLLAARMVSEINHVFGCKFLLQDVFELRNIRDMALHIDFLVNVGKPGPEGAPRADAQHEEMEW